MDEGFIDFVPLLEFHNSGDWALLRSVLDAEEITYFIQGEHVAPYLFHALPMRLMVRRDQVGEVREILRDIEFSFAYNLPEDPPAADGDR